MTNLDRAKAFLDTLPEGTTYFVTTFTTVAGGASPRSVYNALAELDEDLGKSVDNPITTGVTVVILYDRQGQP